MIRNTQIFSTRIRSALSPATALIAALAACLAIAPTQGFAKPFVPDVVGMDRTVPPGVDFFSYANGGWIKSTPIPADRSAYGSSSILAELTAKRVSDLIAHVAETQAAEGSEERQIADYYLTFMDAASIEAAGTKPIEPALARIAAISDRQQLADALGATLRADVDITNNTNLHTDNLFGLWVAQDFNDPSHYSPFLVQGGLAMPDREYYLDPSASMVTIRTKYIAHITAVLQMSGITNAAAKATKVFELEKRIAQLHSTRADSENIQKGNNHWQRKQFDVQAPGLDWSRYFAAAGLDHQANFVVWQPAAVIGLSKLTASEPLETWKDYLRFHCVDNVAGHLSKKFVDERFAFYGKALTGTPELRERWKRGVDDTNFVLGEAVGKLYVAEYFAPAEKARAEDMVRNILAAFAARIDHLDWMAPQTKAKAKAKLAVLKVGVGYPDKWRSYVGYNVVRGDAVGNYLRAEEFEYRRNLAKLGTPVDRSEWVMNAQLVNAVNLPAMNAINFPAAILQPPYFDPNQPAVMDYGGIGATIGHEISHSFDDQGALFDADGRLQNWWQPDDFAHFRESGARLIAQFNTYKPFPDLSVNGAQTLSENIADVAGLNAAYDAYVMSLKGAPPPTAGGFTGDQLFFLSFAQSWREKIREPALRDEIITDGHAPEQYRAYTVRNVDAWYAAFDVKPGQALYLAPQDRVRVW